MVASQPGLGSVRPGRLSSAIDQRTIYRMSRLRAFLMLLGSLALSASGPLIVRDRGPLLGWSTVILFGVCAVAFVIMMFRSPYLKLSVEGVEMGSPFRRGQFILWTEIDNIVPIRISKQPAVGFNRVGAVPPNSTWRAINRGIAGVDFCIMTRLYGLKPDELAAMMNRYWRQARELRSSR